MKPLSITAYGFLIALQIVIAAAAYAIPLGAPIPRDLRLDDLLSTRNASGNGGEILPGAGFCDSASHRPVWLPADDAAHADRTLEWWWWYGHLTASDGRRFGYFILVESSRVPYIGTADYAITDLTTGKFHYGRQTLLFTDPFAVEDGYAFRGDHVSVAGGDGHDVLHVDVDGFALDVSLDATRPPVLDLGDGYDAVYCNDTYFYSRMRMQVSGSLADADRDERVSGSGNFHHAWGFTPLAEVASSRFLAFELEDGRDILLGIVGLRGAGELAALELGTISDASGNVTTLRHGDFKLTPTRFWQRDASCRYPVEWDVEVAGLKLHVTPDVDHAELRAAHWPEMLLLTPWSVYWDGGTSFSGDAAGRGWLDLIQYCLY